MADTITRRWECAQTPEDLVPWLEMQLIGVKTVSSVQRTDPITVDVRLSYLPTWAIVVAVLFFPIGLLALLARRDGQLRLRAEPASSGPGTTLLINGTYTDPVAKRLTTVYDQLGLAAA